MKINKKDKNYVKNKIFSLMDEVHLILGGGISVDDFLDQTSLFKEWEEIIPEEEYSIFVIAVLNNIRRESIINTIIASLSDKNVGKNLVSSFSSKKKKHIPHTGDLPFS